MSIKAEPSDNNITSLNLTLNLSAAAEGMHVRHFKWLSVHLQIYAGIFNFQIYFFQCCNLFKFMEPGALCNPFSKSRCDVVITIRGH